MCGIVGIIAKETSGFYHHQADCFQDLLFVDSLRGQDSTGVFGVLRNRQVRMVKHATHPMNLFATPSWSNFKQLMVDQCHVVVGHNRKATHGVVSNVNAHPFHEQDIILVHNGVVMNHKQMKEVDVDSHAICHAFAEKGYKETLAELTGSFALVWYDLKAKVLRMVRNHERPLSIAETASYVYIASEGDMLAWLLKRCGVSWMQPPVEIPANVVISFGVAPFTRSEEALPVKNHLDVRPYIALPDSRSRWFGGVDDDEDNAPWETQSSASVRTVTDDIRFFEDAAKKWYPRGSSVIYVPHITVPFKDVTTQKERLKTEGHAYIPGNPRMTAKLWLPSEMDLEDASDLLSEGKIRAKVKSVVMAATGDVLLYLEEPEADLWVTTWNKEEFLGTEWDLVCEKFACSKCKTALKAEQAQFTSATVDKDGMVNWVICADCIEKRIHEMPEAMRDAFQQGRNPAV